VEASTTEIDYRGGNAVLGLLRDVTEKKSLKERLLLAQKMESIGRLSGGVAHDLNNLLTPIIGYGDLVLDEFFPDDSRKESVQEILDAALRARDLVRQLLAFSRRQAMDFEGIDLNELVQGFRKLLRRTIRDGIEIEFQFAPSEPFIRGDRGQLEQVIMNLAVNAQDAMPEGGVLTIRTTEVFLDQDFALANPGVSPGHFAQLAISDTGTGMDADTREKIFEPFFTTKGQGEGTGLGLATVYGTVQQHDGTITVESRPAKGTSFHCFLPLADRPAVELTKLESKVTDLEGTETVMVVEDEETIRNLAVKVLSKLGYTVMEAKSPEKCLEKLQESQEPVDLLLTDVVMPGMNGKELYEAVSAVFPDIRVLFMSGFTEDIITHGGIIDDGIPFLQKPFSVDELAKRVREVLKNG